MNVLFVAAEAAPIVKRGGLGDVVGSLPPALKASGVDIKVAIPWYPDLDMRKWKVEEKAGVGETRLGESDVPVMLLGREMFSQAFGEKKQLDVGEEERLFARFSEEIIAFIKRSDWKPDILHGNDWHVSRAMALLEVTTGSELQTWGYREKGNLATMFTIHNLGYFWTSLRQAVLTADIINTVSPSYAQEILTEEFCMELCHELNQRKEDLYGILNGIDYGVWNPQMDTFLVGQYGSDSWREGKEHNKEELVSSLGLQASDRMILGFVGRLDPKQKGVGVLVKDVDRLVELGCQLVVLGSGDPEIERALKEAGERHKGVMSVNLRYDERLAHRIYAGADALVIPSRYEPCGLIQMIAMKYGTLPIAHAVGGLKDTIQDGKTGFLYEDYSAGLVQSVERAKTTFETDMETWERLIQQAMQQDFSWERSAAEYVNLYEKALEKSRG